MTDTERRLRQEREQILDRVHAGRARLTAAAVADSETGAGMADDALRLRWLNREIERACQSAHCGLSWPRGW